MARGLHLQQPIRRIYNQVEIALFGKVALIFAMSVGWGEQ
jgi:hypothetical protein